MGVSRRKALEYADRLMARPNGGLALTLRHTKSGVTLLHAGRAVTRCYETSVGRAQSLEVAKAQGVALPPVGGSVEATVPNGTFFRAIAISSLDLRIPEAPMLLTVLQEEAEMARTTGASIEA